MISAAVSTARTRPVISTRSQAQHGDHRPAPSAHAHQGRVHAQVGGGLAWRGRAEHPVQGDLEGLVGHQRHQRRGHPGGPAEPRGHERIKRPRVADLAGSSPCTRGEQGQDHSDADERGRDAGQAGHRVRGRDHPGRHRQRRHRRPG